MSNDSISAVLFLYKNRWKKKTVKQSKLKNGGSILYSRVFERLEGQIIK